MTSDDDEKKVQDVVDDKHRTIDVELAQFGFTKDMYDESESGVDPAYQAKARRLNEAFQEIGMGKYQVCVHPFASFGGMGVCRSGRSARSSLVHVMYVGLPRIGSVRWLIFALCERTLTLKTFS